MPPVFRFAPSPNGYLHLGHALSALIDFEMARALGGRFLLRIEDIDATRCRPEFEQAIYDDLSWLGIAWEEPVRRQSEALEAYARSLAKLQRDRVIRSRLCHESHRSEDNDCPENATNHDCVPGSVDGNPRDEKMSKEELIQFEGLVIEILPDGRYSVQLDDGYEVVA